jgi:hypothetical protein
MASRMYGGIGPCHCHPPFPLGGVTAPQASSRPGLAHHRMGRIVTANCRRPSRHRPLPGRLPYTWGCQAGTKADSAGALCCRYPTPAAVCAIGSRCAGGRQSRAAPAQVDTAVLNGLDGIVFIQHRLDHGPHTLGNLPNGMPRLLSAFGVSVSTFLFARRVIGQRIHLIEIVS